jgi:hypothetical protein
MTEDVSECLRTLPRTIKIGAYDWRIILEEGENSRCGLTDFETSSIHLWPSNLTSPNHCVGIVLHECLHVIFDNEKLGKSKRNKEAREEQVVLGFEVGLVGLFRDNSRLMTWMKKGLT